MPSPREASDNLQRVMDEAIAALNKTIERLLPETDLAENRLYEAMRYGVLGGGKGTTRDTFELLYRAEAAGARVALFGRKINYAERPLTLVALMRRVIARELTPEQAVVAYHDDLVANDCPPTLAPADDIKITEPTLLADD